MKRDSCMNREEVGNQMMTGATIGNPMVAPVYKGVLLRACRGVKYSTSL